MKNKIIISVVFLLAIEISNKAYAESVTTTTTTTTTGTGYSQNPADFDSIRGTKWAFSYSIGSSSYTDIITFGSITRNNSDDSVGLNCTNQNNDNGVVRYEDPSKGGLGFLAYIEGDLLRDWYFFTVNGTKATGSYQFVYKPNNNASSLYYLDGTCINCGSITTSASTTSIISNTTINATTSIHATTSVNGTTSIATTSRPRTTTTALGIDCPARKVLGNDSPDIENLRAFRDNILDKSAVGRKIISIYYNNVESINETLEQNPTLQSFARQFLIAITPILN